MKSVLLTTTVSLVFVCAMTSFLNGCSKKTATTVAPSTSSADKGGAQITPDQKQDQKVNSSVSTPSAAGTATSSVGTGSSLSGAAQPLTQTAPVQSCFSATFHHKNTSGHSDDEACSHHKNLVQLEQDGINPKSICVRVDGTPVRFQVVSKNKIMVGPVAGPQAKLTVRYCLGKTNCSENCTVPKDEFMEAMGSTDDEESKTGARAPAAAQWDPNDNEKISDVSAEIDGDIMKELSDESDLTVFNGWRADPETPACKH